MKKIFSTIVYKSIYGTAFIISLMPIEFLYGFSSLACIFIYNIFGYRRNVVIQNISRSFPDKKYDEVMVIVRKFYIHFTAYFVEMLKNISISTEELDKKVTFENLDIIEQYIKEDKNVIICLGHCGNWEMLNFLPHKLHCDTYAVYKPLRAKLFDKLIQTSRSRFGMKLIPSKAIARHMLGNKSGKAAYLFLSDQCPGTIDAKYRFRLLNQETHILPGAEKLARIGKCAVVYMHIVAPTKGQYRIICLPICAEAGLTKETEITQSYISLLEKNILEEPFGWLWTHKRWKQ